MRVAIDFAKGVNPTLSPLDVARIYLAVGSCLAATVTDRGALAAMLRTLAAAVEHGDDAKPN